MKLRDLRFDLGLKKMMTEGPFSRSVLFKVGSLFWEVPGLGDCCSESVSDFSLQKRLS